MNNEATNLKLILNKLYLLQSQVNELKKRGRS